MGVLTEFVIADLGDAKRVGKSNHPSQDFDGIAAKGMDPVKLGFLYSILTGQPYDGSFMANHPLLYEGSDDGPWVQQVPLDFVKRLAELSLIDIKTTAAEWAKIAEFSPKFDHWSPDKVLYMLESIAMLCQKAMTENKALLIWMCL